MLTVLWYTGSNSTRESSGPFYDYPMPGVVRSTAEMGTNETVLNEEYPSVTEIRMSLNASIGKEKDIKTTFNEAYASTAKEGNIETAPNEAYDSTAKEGDIEMSPNEAYTSTADIETTPNETYASTAKEGDIETTPNEAYDSTAKVETTPNEAYASIAKEEEIETAPKIYLHCEGRNTCNYSNIISDSIEPFLLDTLL